MNDQLLPDIELHELRLRWEVESTPQLAVRLSDEYRRRGRSQEGLEVLEEAVRAHPTHLAARVALGRFHLELEQSEEAIRVLEGILEEDPTHLVASKLLINVYLDTGKRHQGRDLLDLYRLLNESDPEIEFLEQRFRSEAVSEGAEQTAPQANGTPLIPASGHEVPFTEEAPPASLAAEAIPLPPVETGTPDLSAAEPPPAAALEAPGASGGSASEEATPEVVFAATLGAEPFEGIWEGVGDPHYWSLLAAEGIFALDQTVAEVVEATADESWGETVAVAVEESPAGSQVGLESAPAEPSAEPATATLAELYLAQGHLSEAEQAFREVLSRDPDNELARRRLAEIADGRGTELGAAELLAEVDGELDERQRRIRLLKSYLGRIRAHDEVPEA